MPKAASLMRFRTPLEKWPAVELEQLSDSARKVVKDRADAIRHLYAGKTYRQIREEHGIAPKELNRHIERCQELHPDGNIWGFRVLENRIFVQEPVRKSEPNQSFLNVGTGARSLFQKLIADQPTLRKLLDRQAAQFRSAGKNGGRVDLQLLHGAFVNECNRIFDGNRAMYPLSLKRKGFDGYRDELQRRADATERFSSHSNVRRVHAQETRPFSNVEIDAHKLDLQLTVRFPTPLGGFASHLLTRLNVLVARDRDSDANLAKHLVLNREINHVDLLRCIRKISEPWTPLSQHVKGLDYLPGSGFPSGVIENCRGRMPRVIHLDNAMAHLADNVRGALLRAGYTMNWGIAGEPNSRPLVEALFGALTKQGIQALPTGFSDRESLVNALKNADFASPTIDELDYFLDVFLAAHNVYPSRRLFGETPFELLRREKANSVIRKDMGPNAHWRSLLRVRRTFRIVKSATHRPYVNFKDEQYTSPSLITMYQKQIKSFEAFVDLEDIRYIDPVPIHGWTPDRIIVNGRWQEFAHDIDTRAVFNSIARQRPFNFDHWRSIPQQMVTMLEERARLGRKEATQAARVAPKLMADMADPKQIEQGSSAPGPTPIARQQSVPVITDLGKKFLRDLT